VAFGDTYSLVSISLSLPVGKYDRDAYAKNVVIFCLLSHFVCSIGPKVERLCVLRAKNADPSWSGIGAEVVDRERR